MKVETRATVEYDHRISALFHTGEGSPFRPGPFLFTYTYLSIGHSIIARLGILLQDSDGIISESLTCNQSIDRSKLMILNDSSFFMYAVHYVTLYQ